MQVDLTKEEIKFLLLLLGGDESPEDWYTINPEELTAKLGEGLLTVIEKVTLNKDDEAEVDYLVYCRPKDEHIKHNTILYLEDCGYTIKCEPRTEPDEEIWGASEEVVSWGELSDILEPRDD